jgi:hypothetical protein
MVKDELYISVAIHFAHRVYGIGATSGFIWFSEETAIIKQEPIVLSDGQVLRFICGRILIFTYYSHLHERGVKGLHTNSCSSDRC